MRDICEYLKLEQEHELGWRDMTFLKYVFLFDCHVGRDLCGD